MVDISFILDISYILSAGIVRLCNSPSILQPFLIFTLLNSSAEILSLFFANGHLIVQQRQP